jgi:DNA-binding CsgD family transcriptional regulator
MYDDEDYLGIYGIGSLGLCPQRPPGAQLLSAIRDVHRAGSFLSPRRLSQLVDDFRSRIKSTERLPRFATLTQREKEVLKMLAEGNSVKAIACTLNLSVGTIEAHKFNLMRKLDIHNKARLCSTWSRRKLSKSPSPVSPIQPSFFASQQVGTEKLASCKSARISAYFPKKFMGGQTERSPGSLQGTLDMLVLKALARGPLPVTTWRSTF